MVQDIIDYIGRPVTADIRISDIQVEPLIIPRSYSIDHIVIAAGNVDQSIRQHIEAPVSQAKALGFPGNIFCALYEAILNAYQHGNGCDSCKDITFACSVAQELVHAIVVDQGNLLEKDFINYVLWHRQMSTGEKYVNFYTYSGKQKTGSNKGTGTTFMHNYMDISYHKAQHGGLAVSLVKSL